MTLSTQQIAAIQDAEPVTQSPPEIGAECIPARAEIQRRTQAFIACEDDPRQAHPGIRKAWHSVGHPKDGDAYVAKTVP